MHFEWAKCVSHYSRAVVLKVFQEEAPLCRVNYFVGPQKKTHDENILKLTILLTHFTKNKLICTMLEQQLCL